MTTADADPVPVLPPPRTAVGRLLHLERTVWVSLRRWAGRSPAVPPGGQPFSYVGIVAPTLWTWIAVSAVEIPAIHFLVPWQAVRIALLVVGFWGLVWMVGYAASLYVHPHVVTADVVHVRSSAALDVAVPWDAVESVIGETRSTTSSRSVQLEPTADGTDLVVPVSNQTNIRLALREPRVVLTPRGGFEVTGVRLWVDASAEFLRSARSHLVR